jgi:hypothetical protein
MKKYSKDEQNWVKPDMKPIVVQKLGLDPVSPADAKLHVGSRIFCLLLGHKIVNKQCLRCKQKFGVPKMVNPPHPP